MLQPIEKEKETFLNCVEATSAQPMNGKKDAELKQLKLFWDEVCSKNYDTHSSLTKLFFEEYNLGYYLNSDCKNIVQFGAGSGDILDRYKCDDWDVTAYDYSQKSYEILTQKGIKIRFVDLNSISSAYSIEQLTYNEILIKDLKKVVNVIAIRILQFLKQESLMLLLTNFANLAYPGSIYIFVGKIFIDNEVKENIKEDKCHFNYILSFFSTRKDMKVLLHTTTNKNKNIKNPDNAEIISEGDDEVLIIKKL